MSSLGSIEFAPIIWIFKKMRLNLGSVLNIFRLYRIYNRNLRVLTCSSNKLWAYLLISYVLWLEVRTKKFNGYLSLLYFCSKEYGRIYYLFSYSTKLIHCLLCWRLTVRMKVRESQIKKKKCVFYWSFSKNILPFEFHWQNSTTIGHTNIASKLQFRPTQCIKSYVSHRIINWKKDEENLYCNFESM